MRRHCLGRLRARIRVRVWGRARARVEAARDRLVVDVTDQRRSSAHLARGRAGVEGQGWGVG